MERNDKYRIPLALRRWWEDEGVLVTAALAVVAPGVLAFIGEWLRTDGMIQPERVMCCIGAGFVASTAALILGVAACDWWGRRKERQ